MAALFRRSEWRRTPSSIGDPAMLPMGAIRSHAARCGGIDLCPGNTALLTVAPAFSPCCAAKRKKPATAWSPYTPLKKSILALNFLPKFAL
jgi:hypothetical protein